MRTITQSTLGGLTAALLAVGSPALAQDESAATPEQPTSESAAPAEETAPAEPAAPQMAQPAAPATRAGEFGVSTRGERNTYSMGTVQGTVQALDFDQGLIRLRSSGGTVTLRSRPMDMANLNPGDVVALEYANYNGALWIEPKDSASVSDFAQFGTLTGNVTQVNKGLGTITVRGRTFRAHPEQLEQVIPGQFISLGYANISGTNWVAGIEGAYHGGSHGGAIP